MVIDRSGMFSQKIVENQTLLPYKEVLVSVKQFPEELQAKILQSWAAYKKKRKST